MAKWKEHRNDNKFIYLSPTLKAGYSPCINPFDIAVQDEQYIELVAQELT